MSRFTLPLLLGVCALGLWGCGTSANLVTGKPWNKRARNTERLLADNPLRERSDAKNSARQRTASSLNESEAAQARSQNAHLQKFDDETLDLIEEELARTPPEERAQFYNDVISLEPAMVRQIIHTRRIVRQVGQDAPSSRLANSKEFVADQDAGGIKQISGEQFVENPPRPEGDTSDAFGREPSRDPGLGAADPWQRQTQPASSSGWSNDPTRPAGDLPFNQIPSMSGTGHSAGYTPGEGGRNPGGADFANPLYRQQKAPTNIEPPPGGAQSPVKNFREAVSALPNAPRMHQNARVPTDYNPQVPPVPNYGQNGGDPFASGSGATVRIASSNPNQPLPGVSNTLGLGDAFGQPAEAAGTANTGPGNNFSGDADFSRLIASLEAEVARLRYADQTEPGQKTAYIQKHVYLRMLYLMSGQEARAVTAIPDIPPADQEFWQQTFWAMSNYFDTEAMPDSEYRATQTIAQLRTAIQKLQENARLELRNVAFCHKISSFGNFDRFPQDEFGPGQPVLVYAEVVNFKSKPTSLPNKPNESFYQTQLKSSIEIHRLGPSGELVERFDFEPTEDLCHNQRRDYFHSYEFTIPQRISLGPHVMTLTVEDQLNRKVATYRLNFMVK